MKNVFLTTLISLIFGIVFSQDKLDSLQNIAGNSNASLGKANAFLEMAEILYLQNPDTLIYFSERCLSTLKDLNQNNKNAFEYKKIESDAYNNMGYAYYTQGIPKKAVEYYDQALKLKEVIGDRDGLNSVKNNLALVYGDQGNLVEALDIYFGLLALAQDENHKLDEAKALNNIGYIYHLQKDYNNALYYYNELIQVEEAKESPVLMGATFNNMGALYNSLDKKDSALIYYGKALQIRRDANHIDGVATTLTNIAKIHIDNKDYPLARELLNESIQICRELNLLFLEATTLSAIAQILVAEGNLSQAEQILERLEWIWNETNSYKTGIHYAEIGLLVNREKKDWHQAFIFIELKIDLEEKMASEEMIRLSQQRKFEVEYKVRKKEADLEHAQELAVKEKEKAISEEKNARLVITVILISIGVVLLVFALLLLYRNYRYRSTLMKQRLYNEELRRHALELERDKKSRELTGLSLRMTSNSQYIKEIDGIIASSREMKREDLDDLLRRLQVKVKTNDVNQRTWEEFQRQFEGVHTDFVYRLKSDYPKLTQKEVRLCMLIRLNAGSDEIINLLGITKNTLKSSRYRIHKKLKLPKGDRLYDFVLAY